MIFILAASSGARIGEILGLDISQHISPDCSTLRIDQQAYRGHIVPYVKTDASYREIDLHETAAETLNQYIGNRTTGLLFCTNTGGPLNSSNIYQTHLHLALVALGWPSTRVQ